MKFVIYSCISGHAFRRTSATVLANTGASIETLKRHGGWRSSTVAEQYIEDSLAYKRKTGDAIASAIDMDIERNSVSSNIIGDVTSGDKTDKLIWKWKEMKSVVIWLVIRAPIILLSFAMLSEKLTVFLRSISITVVMLLSILVNDSFVCFSFS